MQIYLIYQIGFSDLSPNIDHNFFCKLLQAYLPPPPPPPPQKKKYVSYM